MAIDSGAIDSGPIDAPAGADGGPFKVSATINLDTRFFIQPFAIIRLNTVESVSVSATIKLDTTKLKPSATIKLQTTETLKPSATILLSSVDLTKINRSHGNWRIIVKLDGLDVSSLLVGNWSISQTEDASAIANFILYPAVGIIDPTDYVNKRCEIYFVDEDSDGTVNHTVLRFLGKVSDPVYNISTGNLTIQATSDLNGTLDNQDRDAINELIPNGVWSEFVFDEGAQGWTYAQDLISTTPASFWHSTGGIRIVDWAAKVTADYEFTESEILEDTLTYQIADKRSLLNHVKLEVDYRFDRQRQRTIHCNWLTTQSVCDFLINGWERCQRSMIESAAETEGWVVQGEINFNPGPKNDAYRCFPFSSGPSSAKYIIWTDTQADEFAWSASWKAAKRWLQKVTERYQIDVVSPQSQAANGELATTETYRVISEQDVSDWLNEEGFDGVGLASGWAGVGGNVTAGGYVLGDQARDATDDERTGRVAADKAREVGIKLASASVLEAHRENRVAFEVPFQPQLNLSHTVRANTAHLQSKGKVYGILDQGNIEAGRVTTQITLAISRHTGVGLVTADPLVEDPQPVKPVETGIPTNIGLLTHIGGLKTSTPINDSMQGYFTNYTYDPGVTNPFAADPKNPSTIVYPREFVVRYPEITGSQLDHLSLPAEQSVNVDVPQDELTLIQ